MTNAAIAAALLAGGTNTPQQMELVGTRVLTCKGTVDHPAGGCGRGNSDVGSVVFNFLGDIVCASGASTPQDIEQVSTIVCCRGHRTDSLNY